MEGIDLEVVFNRYEAVLWFAFALLCLCASLRPSAKHRRDLLILTAAFGAFGVSDIIESHTGAWWRPWWLFVLKAACVLAMAPPAWRLWKSRPRKPGKTTNR
jgi:hypothetical protein